jgi:hypothetical protein
MDYKLIFETQITESWFSYLNYSSFFWDSVKYNMDSAHVKLIFKLALGLSSGVAIVIASVLCYKSSLDLYPKHISGGHEKKILIRVN